MELNLKGMDLIRHFFPKLSKEQDEQLAYLEQYYKEWNSKINMISRKDIDMLYEHHILHSLSIAKVANFKPYTKILDIGTGGGFPGIPLAIMFPECRFKLIDARAKKIMVVDQLAKELKLKNVDAQHIRAEQLEGREFDFIVSRAVTRLKNLVQWGKPVISKENYNYISNGYFILKGGDLKEELSEVKGKTKQYELYDIFPLDWYSTKFLLYLKA